MRLAPRLGHGRNRDITAAAFFLAGTAGAVFCLSLFFTAYTFLFARPVSMFFPFFLLSAALLSAAVYMAGNRGGTAGRMITGLSGYLRGMNDRRILCGMVILLSVIIYALSRTRYDSYSSNFDLAIYDQIIWNSANGRLLLSSIMGDCNSLGNHFEPVLLLLAPFYRIFPDVGFLFAVQALALSSALVPLYLISRRLLGARIMVFGALAAYFLSRGIQGAGMFEFHPDCFLPTLLLYAYYFLITDRGRGTLWMCLAMLLCKENAAFLVLGLGMFAVTRREQRRFGILLSAAAFFYWVVVTRAIMPFFSCRGGSGQYQYYSWLPFGPSLKDNLAAFAGDPAGFIMLFFDGARAGYYFQLLGPTGFLALLSPPHFALFMLPAGIFVLGSFGHLGLLNIMAQYSAHTVPAVFIAAVNGLAFLRKKLSLKFPGYEKRCALILSLYLVLCAAGFYGKTSGHRMDKFIRAGKVIGAKDITKALAANIPPDASVTSTVNISAHLSHRRKLYLLEEMKADSAYPRQGGGATSAVPYREDPVLSRLRYESDYIVAHRRFSGERFPSVVKEISGRGYREVYRDPGGLVIFRKSK